MKNMQRWLAVLLAGCMMLTVGCGNASGEDGQAPAQETEEPALDAGETAQEPEESTENVEEMGAPQVRIQSNNVEKYSEDGSIWLFHGEYDTLGISGDGYEALGKAAEQWSGENEEKILKNAEDSAAAAEKEGKETGEYRDYYSNSSYESLTLTRSDERAVSLVGMSSGYSGGAHGFYGFFGLNFDAQTGERLELGDLLKDDGHFQEKASSYMIGKLKETYGDELAPGYEDTVNGIWAQEPAWYMDGAGITFVFDPYMLGSYAMGAAQVTVPYGEVDEYLKEEYLPDGWEGVYLIPENEDVKARLPLSSLMDNVLRFHVETNPEYDETKAYLSLNEDQSEPLTFARTDKAYLIYNGGFCYVVLDGDYASDDYGTFVYNISTGVIKESDYLEGAGMQTHSVVNTEGLTLRVVLNVLGTYSAQMDYTIDRDGKLVQQDEFFRIPEDNFDYRLLTTVKELPVVIEDGSTVLPVGSRIRIKATDNQGIVQFQDEDTKAEGDIHFTRGEGDDAWIIYIDGVPDMEYFENVPYAG